MTGTPDNKRTIKFIKLSLLIFSLFSIYLFFSGYFEIGFLSDDYLNFISAKNSSLTQKFTSSIPYESNLHFRPLWFLSINVMIAINNLLGSSPDNFLLYRIDNLFCLCLLSFISSFLLFKITRRVSISIVFLLMIILYPNIVNDICWTVGKAGILCGIFLFSSLYFSFSYIERKSVSKILLTLLFFVLALLTKESAIMLPFIIVLLVLITFGKSKLSEIKNLIICELIILFLYTAYRILILPGTLTGLSEPGILNTFGVFSRALVSMVLPLDYLSIQNDFFDLNFFFLLYLLPVLILVFFIVRLILRSGNSGKLFLLALIFIAAISPNLMAGYFRPQLSLIPFLIFYLSLLILLSKIPVTPVLIKLLFYFIIIFWLIQDHYLIKDWKYAYEKSVNVVNDLIDSGIDFNKRNIILGLPSRYRQSYLLDNTFAQYNYWKYNDLSIRDEIYDFVHTGALDSASLNSELSLKQLSENEFEIETTGPTQFFQMAVSNTNEFKDEHIEIELGDENSFDKYSRMKVRVVSENVDVYYFSKDKLILLN